MGDHTEQMHTIGMTGIHFQDLTIEALRCGQVTGLMVSEGFSEQILNARCCPLQITSIAHRAKLAIVLVSVKNICVRL